MCCSDFYYFFLRQRPAGSRREEWQALGQKEMRCQQGSGTSAVTCFCRCWRLCLGRCRCLPATFDRRRSSPIERGGQAAATSQAQAPAPAETGDGRRPRSLLAAHLLLSQRLPFLPSGTSRSLPQEEVVEVRAVHQELQARARSKLRPCDRSSRRDAKPQEFPKEAQRPTQGASQGP